MKRISTEKHGTEPREGGGIEWLQYWRGVQHVWYWCGVPVWFRLRKRNRPMYEFIKRACGT